MSKVSTTLDFTKPRTEDQLLVPDGVQVSASGQFTVSIDALRELPSFSSDVKKVAQIREKLQSKR